MKDQAFKRVSFQVRLLKPLHTKMVASAKANERSLNSEVVRLLEIAMAGAAR